MKRLVLTGDSHVVALGRGLAQLKRRGDIALPEVAAAKLYSFPQSLRPFFTFDGERIAFVRQDHADIMAQLTGSATIGREQRDLTFALVMGFTTTLLVRMEVWSQFAPWRLAEQAKRMPLSDGVVATLARAHFEQTLDFYKAMRALDLDVIAVEAPQVRGDDPAFKSKIQRRIILEVDRIARDAVRDDLRAMDVPIVNALQHARGASGFLKRGYSSIQPGDYHHADHRFGRAMVCEILDAVRER